MYQLRPTGLTLAGAGAGAAAGVLDRSDARRGGSGAGAGVGAFLAGVGDLTGLTGVLAFLMAGFGVGWEGCRGGQVLDAIYAYLHTHHTQPPIVHMTRTGLDRALLDALGGRGRRGLGRGGGGLGDRHAAGGGGDGEPLAGRGGGRGGFLGRGLLGGLGGRLGLEGALDGALLDALGLCVCYTCWEMGVGFGRSRTLRPPVSFFEVVGQGGRTVLAFLVAVVGLGEALGETDW